MLANVDIALKMYVVEKNAAYTLLRRPSSLS